MSSQHTAKVDLALNPLCWTFLNTPLCCTRHGTVKVWLAILDNRHGRWWHSAHHHWWFWALRLTNVLTCSRCAWVCNRKEEPSARIWPWLHCFPQQPLATRKDSNTTVKLIEYTECKLLLCSCVFKNPCFRKKKAWFISTFCNLFRPRCDYSKSRLIVSKTFKGTCTKKNVSTKTDETRTRVSVKIQKFQMKIH